MRLRDLCLGILASMAPLIASAEPAASMSHMPYLWALAGGVSGLFSWIAIILIGRTGRLKTPFRKWALAIILLAVFMVFLSPVIIGLGSILITGRTM